MTQTGVPSGASIVELEAPPLSKPRTHGSDRRNQRVAAYRARREKFLATQRSTGIDLRTSLAGIEPTTPGFGAHSEQRQRCRVCYLSDAAFRATAAFTSALKARASTFSPSWRAVAPRLPAS